MKKSAFVIAALAIISLSSCYVEVQGEHRQRHPFWHHRNETRVEIRGENNIKHYSPTQQPVDIYSAKK